MSECTGAVHGDAMVGGHREQRGILDTPETVPQNKSYHRTYMRCEIDFAKNDLWGSSAQYSRGTTFGFVYRGIVRLYVRVAPTKHFFVSKPTRKDEGTHVLHIECPVNPTVRRPIGLQQGMGFARAGTWFGGG